MRFHVWRILVAGIFVLALGAQSTADWRNYVWTFQYQTMGRGKAEVQPYFTLSTPDMNDPKDKVTAEHQLSLQIGMNERYEFTGYQIFSQAPGEALRYDGFKLRWRYRLSDKGQFVTDPTIFVQYTGTPDFSEHVAELRLVLSRDFGKINVTLNPIVDFSGNGDWQTKAAYTAGVSRQIARVLKIGVEFMGSEDGHYIGPVIAHGRSNLWVALGSAFKLGNVDDGQPEFQVRLIEGIGLF